MKLFDIFFTVIYNWRSKILTRCKDDAKLNALAFLVIWLTFLLISMSNIIGLLKDNKYSYFIVNNMFISYVCIGIFLFIIFGIPAPARFYRVFCAKKENQPCKTL